MNDKIYNILKQDNLYNIYKEIGGNYLDIKKYISGVLFEKLGKKIQEKYKYNYECRLEDNEGNYVLKITNIPELKEHGLILQFEYNGPKKSELFSMAIKKTDETYDYMPSFCKSLPEIFGAGKGPFWLYLFYINIYYDNNKFKGFICNDFIEDNIKDEEFEGVLAYLDDLLRYIKNVPEQR